MTRAAYLLLHPDATEARIRANCDGAIARMGPAPAPARIPASNAKGSPSARKPSRRQLVPRTRNAATWTEAQFWGALRSNLRRLSMFWRPAAIAKRAARIPFHGYNGQQWAFICADCNGRFKEKLVQVDHIEPVGALTDFAHLPDFVARLLPEDPKKFRVVCKKCHQLKTNAERGIVAGPVQGELL